MAEQTIREKITLRQSDDITWKDKAWWIIIPCLWLVQVTVCVIKIIQKAA